MRNISGYIGQFISNLILLFVLAAIMYFLPQQSRGDWNKIDAKNEENRKEMVGMIKEIKEEVGDFHASMQAETRYTYAIMQAETKDFHGRLCTIEERNKDK